MKSCSLLIIILTDSVAQASETLAYIDPGTGSLIFQAVVAVLVTGGFYIKRTWGSFKGFFKKGGTDDASIDE